MYQIVVYSDAGHLEDGGLMSQSLSPYRSGGKGFYKDERSTQQRDQGRQLKVLYLQTSTFHSDKDNVGPVCILILHHPDSVVEGEQISQS